ncbi:MAG: hypothetical protein J6W60_00695 [Treponema sp.]|nr:hypothetical protein [Treponema sp.]
MKNNRLLKATLSSAAVCLTLVFAGCGNVWTGGKLTPTEYSFEGAENTATAAVGTSDSMHDVARYAKLYIEDNEFYKGEDNTPLTSIPKAGVDTSVIITIKSFSKLDQQSVAGAFKFYTLTANTYGAPRRSEAALSSSLIDFTSVTGSGNAEACNVTSVAEFKVNTSSVTTNAIAVLADATILKDMNGRPVLNANQNEVCGEASDSLVRYIGVTNKSDGSAATALTLAHGEDFSPKLVYDAALNVSVFSNGNGTYTVKSGSASYMDYQSSPTLKYKTDLASNLSSLWKIQTREDGAGPWLTSDLTFTYNSSTSTYESQDITLAPGTKYRLVKNVPASENGLAESTQSVLLYGHEARQSYTRAYTEYEDSEDATYFTAEPSYIITTSAFAQGLYSAAAIETAQKSLLTVTPIGNKKFDVQLGTLSTTQLEYDAYSDFILTDGNLNKIPCTVRLKDSKTLSVEAENCFYTGAISLWVGRGTSIKTNPVTGNNQTKFGTFKDSDKGVASGYVKLYEPEP